MKCPGGGIIHWRKGGLSGPFFTSIGGACVKTAGNFRGVNKPGDGARAIRGEVVSTNSIHITFTQCVAPKAPACASPFGLTLLIEGVSAPITGAAMQVEPEDNVMLVTTSTTINPGDTVVWSYDDSNGCWTSCGDELESIGDQGPINADNPLVLAGHFILLEAGGSDIILVEDDTADTDGIILEEAA